jgi:hypothetical protein
VPRLSLLACRSPLRTAHDPASLIRRRIVIGREDTRRNPVEDDDDEIDEVDEHGEHEDDSVTSPDQQEQPVG